MADLIGKIISARYRVESFLGKGGMAEVYKVWDSERNVPLAMKVLHADLAEDRVFLRRFKREAQTLATLQHPNIVRFYGLEQDGDLVYMLMDYVEGTTLRKEIFQANAPLSQERIQVVMKSVCAALYYAHKSGFVHCDIKPANFMIHNNGNVFVADFGISRMTEASTATMVGAGTPAYMSPEQIKGADPAPQMDIYALGIVLFEMLTGGERPFTGESAKTTGTNSEKIRWEQLKMAAPPPSLYNKSISPSMDEIVLKCLDKTPQNRYLSAMDLYGDLVTLRSAPVQSKSIQQPNRELLPPTAFIPEPPQYTARIQPTNNNRRLMGIGVVAIGILCVGLIVAGSGMVSYQQSVNATGTVEAKSMYATATKQAENLYATATKQEENVHTTATKQEQSIRATATKLAQLTLATSTPAPLFNVRLYNESADKDVECIECKVENLEYPKKPGHYYWSLDFPINKSGHIDFGWCTTTQKILDQNWEEMAYELIIDSYSINLSEINKYKTREENNFCYGYQGVLENWTKGLHSYIWIHHVRNTVFDGWDTYEAGDYIFEFKVAVK